LIYLDEKQRITCLITYWGIDAKLKIQTRHSPRFHSNDCGNQHQGCFLAGLVFGKLKKERSGFSKGKRRERYLPGGSWVTAKLTPNIE